MNIWYAVNRSRQGRVFLTKPKKNVLEGVWEGNTVGWLNMVISHLVTSDELILPNMSFNDSPVKIKISVNYG